MEEQEELKKLQLPFVEEVVNYCHGLGFWGFCGVDVLFDSHGLGYLVGKLVITAPSSIKAFWNSLTHGLSLPDINPRVTGSCPALMTLTKLKKEFGFTVGLFRRSGQITYLGTPEDLFQSVNEYNKQNEGKSRIVIHSCFKPDSKDYTRVNIGVYGTDLEQCKSVLNEYAKASPPKVE